jgi:hypothetical protein
MPSLKQFIGFCYFNEQCDLSTNFSSSTLHRISRKSLSCSRAVTCRKTDEERQYEENGRIFVTSLCEWSKMGDTISTVEQSNPITCLDRPLVFQEVEAPRFLNNRQMKVVRLSALSTDRLYPQEILLVLISV